MFEFLMLTAFLGMGLSQLLPKENDHDSTRNRRIKRKGRLHIIAQTSMKRPISPRVHRSRLSPVMRLHHTNQ